MTYSLNNLIGKLMKLNITGWYLICPICAQMLYSTHCYECEVEVYHP